MSKSWEFLEECGRLLSTTVQRNLLSEGEYNRLANLVTNARNLLLKSYKDIGHKNVYISFNGGKESIVVLHLHRLALISDVKESGDSHHHTMNVVYFKDRYKEEFPEIISFIDYTVKKYNIDLRVIEGDWHVGVPKLLKGQKGAFIIGSRESDFNRKHISAIQEGDIENIQFTRIHPIVDWNYGDVWNFIRLFSLDYCKLYDIGYTSIGSVYDTVENPHLRNPDGSYSPAYKLHDWSLERYGRPVK